VLEPTDDGRTRLLIRSRYTIEPRWIGVPASWLAVEPAHFIMERGMLLGIKSRVEAGEPDCLPVRILKTAVGFADGARTLRELSRR